MSPFEIDGAEESPFGTSTVGFESSKNGAVVIGNIYMEGDSLLGMNDETLWRDGAAEGASLHGCLCNVVHGHSRQHAGNL